MADTALLLFYLINRIEGHVRFVPLLAGLVVTATVTALAHRGAPAAGVEAAAGAAGPG